ncbi:acyl-CoA dehydrogenase [Plantibacter flavus]|uniref:acyl-CoA dehydrogenase n=1 Tax=Plantibacter flavus TaxID=150123 RepID=UPI003F135FAA
MIRLQSTAWPDDVSELDLTALHDGASAALGDIESRIAFAPRAAALVGTLEQHTAGRHFAGLGAIAAVEVTLARVVEPHLDALGILGQAGREASSDSSWGVFAAEAPGLHLDATQGPDGWRLNGVKPWCSLASRLSDALVTAHTGPGERRLFAVSLTAPGVTTDDDAWLARGLPLVASGPVEFSQVPASPVGEDGWYLRRPGFSWGGIGVAACWWGGAVPLVDRLLAAARTRPGAELLLRTLGTAAIDLAIAEQAIAEAARAIEQGRAEGAAGPRLAQRVRSTVRGRVDAIRAAVLAALGPGPLTTEPAHLSRMSDLELYVLQDHGDRDLARYGRMLLEVE